MSNELDEVTHQALMICDDMRTQPVLQVWRELVRDCVSHPERTARVIMCLAVWVDLNHGLDGLHARQQSVIDFRINETGKRFQDIELIGEA